MHFHLMSGPVGCLPDNVETRETDAATIDAAHTLFSDLCASHFRRMMRDLAEYGDHRFEVAHNVQGSIPCNPGADYVEIVPCSDVECADAMED